MNSCTAETHLREAGLKVTQTRLAALAAAMKQNGPFSAGTLHSSLKKDFDLVTLYRTLESLSQKKILRQVAHGEGGQYFEMACAHHPIHAHFICSQCQTISCLKQLDEAISEKLFLLAPKNEIDEINVNLNGTCPTCLKTEKSLPKK
jgi:Fur family ferric uptake transcriptional regulator